MFTTALRGDPDKGVDGFALAMEDTVTRAYFENAMGMLEDKNTGAASSQLNK